MSVIRFAARDPGAANILVGLFAELPADLRAGVDIWAQEGAASRLGALGAPFKQFRDDVSAEALEAAWDLAPAQALVTGTSHYRPFDSVLWSVARKHGAPSLALIDYWSNLPQRFRDGRPDRVGALDPRQADALVALGFARDRIIVTGHPWLARLAPSEPRSAGSDGVLRVLFVSERIHDDVAEGAQPSWGFDELDALSQLVAAARRRAEAGQDIELTVKFHPYESPERILRAAHAWRLPSNLRLRFVPRDESAGPWVAAADLIVGIASMLLIEAILAGKPVVSLQPGLTRESLYPPAQLGYCPALTDPEIIAGVLDELLASPDARRRNVAELDAFRTALRAGNIDAVVEWMRAALMQPVGAAP